MQKKYIARPWKMLAIAWLQAANYFYQNLRQMAESGGTPQ